jgi:hypothetical protein
LLRNDKIEIFFTTIFSELYAFVKQNHLFEKQLDKSIFSARVFMISFNILVNILVTIMSSVKYYRISIIQISITFFNLFYQ